MVEAVGAGKIVYGGGQRQNLNLVVLKKIYLVMKINNKIGGLSDSRKKMSEKAFYTNKEEWNDYLARLAIY